MARRAKPWYWKSRKAWYIILDGKKTRLADTKSEAYRRYHELMAEPQKRTVASDSLLGVIDVYLEWVQKHRAPDTYEWYRQRLQALIEHLPAGLKAADLKPYHVQQFIDEMPHSNGTKRNYVRAIKRAMRWSEEQGYIDRSPIAFLKKPKQGTREVYVTEPEYDQILDNVSDRHFRDLILTTWETGCRPQESLRVEARHVDVERCRWVFPKSEAKGEEFPRIVYLNEVALEITKRLMLQYPQGTLFRNSNGDPWTTDAAGCAFVRVQLRLGKAEMKRQGIELDEDEITQLSKMVSKTKTEKGKVVPKKNWEIRKEARRKITTRIASSLATRCSLYALRHTWATNALRRGIDPLTVAILLGHQDPSTLSRVYQHLSLSPEHMLDQARKATKKKSG